MKDGPHTRIHRSRGRPVVFDYLSYKKQKKIQDELVEELPHLKGVIYSEPAISGYTWKVSDYIDLYYDHYAIVIQKIDKAITDGE